MATRMTSPLPPEVMSSCGRDLSLARRRLQQKGDLFDQGGMWKLRWHEDKIGPDGKLSRGWSRAVHIGPSMGSGKLTEKEAQRWVGKTFSRNSMQEPLLDEVAQRDGGMGRTDAAEHVALLKRSGRTHYQSMLTHGPL